MLRCSTSQRNSSTATGTVHLIAQCRARLLILGAFCLRSYEATIRFLQLWVASPEQNQKQLELAAKKHRLLALCYHNCGDQSVDPQRGLAAVHKAIALASFCGGSDLQQLF